LGFVLKPFMGNWNGFFYQDTIASIKGPSDSFAAKGFAVLSPSFTDKK